MAGALVGGAALGAAFQALSEAIGTVIKKGYLFRRKLRKITKKLKALEPLIKEITNLNAELDMSSHNADFLQIMEDGAALVTELWRDSEKTRWWNFPRNTGKLAALDGSLADLMQVLQAQHVVIGMRTLAVVNNIARGGLLRMASALPLPPPPVGGGCCFPPNPPVFDVGLETPLLELKGEVFREDRGPVIVVVAPPGCGKTTLVQKLCKDSEFIERLKGNILFLKVSRTPDLSAIAERIYDHYGRRVPKFCDDEDTFNCLELLLREVGKSSPVLLVLDDVWSESGSLIDGLSFVIPGYKILVTSRFEFRQFGAAYRLETLSDDDAETLFSHYAGLKGTTNIHESLVKEVVQHCKRCPLSLKLIGSALCGESSKIWRRELDKWSKRVSSILDFKEELLLRLQSSVEFIGGKDEILKDCFIDLGSFPEDRRIPATALIDIWTELYGVEEKVALEYLLCLNTMNMANLVVTRRDVDEDDDYYSEHFLTLHDMLRELAIHYSNQNSGKIKRLVVESSGNKLANSANVNARLLSISTDGMLSSEWRDMKLPETEVLVLNFLKKDQVLPDLVETMSQLKVLIVSNYGFYPSELRNFQSVSYLTNLKKMRLERVEIPSFTSIKLDSLQKLSFFMCKIGQAFSFIDISEAFPNLGEMNIDYCGDLVRLPDGICDMVKMKVLSVTHCHRLASLPEKIGNMSSIEVFRIRSCIDLTALPASLCKLPKLWFLDISDCFSIKSLPEDIGKLCGLKKLNMKGCSRLQDLPPSVLDFEELEEVVCDEDMKELWELYFPSDSKIEFTLAKEDINLNFL